MPQGNHADSGPLEVVEHLTNEGVGFVIVGVAGINFYARDASQVVATQDIDLLLRPDMDNLLRAITALRRLGFELEAGGEPFLDDAPSILQTVVDRGATLTARGPDGTLLDLMLSGAGLEYDPLDARATRFRLGDSEVAVGALETLLESKALSGREKDRAFLALFRARFEESDD